MAVRILWLAVGALLLFAAPAHAQSPGSCAEVAVTVDGGDGTLSVEEPVTFPVTVSNEGPATGTPLDQPADVELTVAGVPEGWTASFEDATLEVLPGQSAQTMLTVGLSSSAAKAAELTIRATLTYGVPDVLGGATGCTATSTAQLALAKEESLTRQVLETVGAWIYVVMGALVLAVLMATKLSLDARRTAVALTADLNLVRLPAGARGTIPVQVENISRRHDRVQFHLSVVPDGWLALLPLTEVELAPGEVHQLFLQVNTPADAQPGDLKAITMLATSRVAPRRPASAVLEIQVDPDAKAPRAPGRDPAFSRD